MPNRASNRKAVKDITKAQLFKAMQEMQKTQAQLIEVIKVLAAKVDRLEKGGEA